MFSFGFGIPLLLATSDSWVRWRKGVALFAGTFLTAFVVDAWLSVAPFHRFLALDLWFIAGAAAYLVLKSPLFERETDPSPALDAWRSSDRRHRRSG
jgi:hypothetical protein